MSNYKSSVVRRLAKKNLITPPSFVEGSTVYETMMGSVAYGVSTDTSDCDVYGFCMPPKDVMFPHLAGYIPGFSKQIPKFEQYQEHHINEKDTGKEWDLNIYSILKYFKLCMDNNPNMIDSLFTKQNMVLTESGIARHVRDNRKKFLHKGSWHKFRGYAYGQVKLMKVKQPKPGSKRYDSVIKHGFDVKFAYHVVRLIDEVDQIMRYGDIDLMRDKARLKAIRAGEWTMQQVIDHLESQEKMLEKVYHESKAVPHGPDEQFLTELLLECFEMHYGSMGNTVKMLGKEEKILRDIRKLVENY